MVRKIYKYLIYIPGSLLAVLLLYVSIALFCSYIPYHSSPSPCKQKHLVYLSTNGVHLDIVMSSRDTPHLNHLLQTDPSVSYMAYGWGDKDFYLNVKDWEDLSLPIAWGAISGQHQSLLHITSYKQKKKDWIVVDLCAYQLHEIEEQIVNSFSLEDGKFTRYDGYGNRDHFYAAKGKYHCFNTCNSWANRLFKKAALKASVWTPFDFGLLYHYQ